MAGLAHHLGRYDEQAVWQERQNATRAFMLEHMWDDAEGFCYPVRYGLERVNLKTSDIYPGMYVGVV